jgi:transposase
MRVVHQQHYEETFRHEALALLERSDRTLSQVADGLGIPPATLRYWYKSGMSKRGKQAGPGRPMKLPISTPATKETLEARIARLERENAALRKENEDLKLDREILKKAAAFFAKESE